MAKKLKHCNICPYYVIDHETRSCPMLTCSLCAKMGHIKTDCHLKTQNSWVILVPKGQKIPTYLEAIKDRPRKRKKTRNGVYLIQNSTKVDLYKIRLPEKSTYSNSRRKFVN